MVAMTKERSLRLKLGKWLNCIFTSEVMLTIFGSYDHLVIICPVCVFYDQWLFCLVAMGALDFKIGNF